MSQSGGKHKVNKSLKAWVTFVKKVQKEEKLSYKDAIHRAKQRKDKGEKWMKGGEGTIMEETIEEEHVSPNMTTTTPIEEEEISEFDIPMDDEPVSPITGGRIRKRKRKTRGGNRRSRHHKKTVRISRRRKSH